MRITTLWFFLFFFAQREVLVELLPCWIKALKTELIEAANKSHRFNSDLVTFLWRTNTLSYLGTFSSIEFMHGGENQILFDKRCFDWVWIIDMWFVWKQGDQQLLYSTISNFVIIILSFLCSFFFAISWICKSVQKKSATSTSAPLVIIFKMCDAVYSKVGLFCNKIAMQHHYYTWNFAKVNIIFWQVIPS